MSRLYHVILILGKLLLNVIAQLSFLFSPESKLIKFAKGQQGLLRHIRKEMKRDDMRPVIWLHASSLGEYGIARPIIKSIKANGNYRIVVTFFSSTGYEALIANHPDVDHVFYLPLDTAKNARQFIEIIRPEKAVFMVSEYWIHYLKELKENGIPTYLVSAVIRRDSSFFKWYGGLFRTALNSFTHFFVLNEESGENLGMLGHGNYSVVGDPLFDNAAAIAATHYDNPVVDKFVGHKEVFMAGSISDDKDLQLVSRLADVHRDIRFIIVPHEIRKDVLNDMKAAFAGKSLCFSECDVHTDFSDAQILLIDYLGDLAYLYRYGQWAYVGGGFTPYLHSLIEATVYGLPVAFGPVIHRKVMPEELIKLGIGQIVQSEDDLLQWFERLKNDSEQIKAIRNVALEYSRKNSGVTSTIIQVILEQS